jgi:hypothetical protein
MRSIYLSLAIVVLVFVAACSKDKGPTAPTSTVTMALSGNLAFGNISVGSAATASLTIANAGTSPLVITSIGYPTGFTGNFASGTIAPGASQVVTVTFTPTSAAAFTGTITVNATGATGTNTIAVSGTGVVTPTFTLSGLVTESAPTTSTVLAGARVMILDGANAGKAATTGVDGRYSITGAVNGGYTVTATLAGYTSAVLPVGIDGNTTLNIRLDPIGSRTSFGSGTYRLTTDIPAGRYYSDPANGCHFQRLRGFGGTSADVIVDGIINFDAGQWIVDLLATDAGFQTDANCNFWFTTPRRGLAPGIAPGMWIVGAQITPGTYRAENSTAGCYWQRVSNFTGGADAIIANAFASSSGAQIVTIASTDAGFSGSVECGSWTRTP